MSFARALPSEWILVPKDTWREETARYKLRLDAAVAVDAAATNALSSYWPGVFWPESQPPPEAAIASRLATYAVNLFAMACQVRSIVRDQWLAGLFLVVPLNTRFVLEAWGAIHFARLTLDRLVQEGDLKREEQRTNRLTFGARSQVRLPWGGIADMQSFNVLEFVRGLTDVRPDAEELYNFLSEASHPNMIQNFYFQMAGPPISNWDNQAFNNHGHSLLNRTLEAFEASARGMEQDVAMLLKNGTQYIRQYMP